jgi:beta-xylosidase
MYYSVHDINHNTQCISVASATSPSGPFVDKTRSPLVCQWKTDGGSIDPDFFVDNSGTPYLIWKSDDNSIGKLTHLWGQQLAPNGLSLVGSPVTLLSADESWQGGIIEGPALVYAAGTYYLFYGANNYSSPSSAIGYATCSGPLGPCTDQSTNPWLYTNYVPGLVGPQGPSFFTDASRAQHIAFDAWNGPVGYSNGGVRSMWTDTISFSAGQAPSLG